MPDGRAAAALRRLHPGDPVAHAARCRPATPPTVLGRAARLLAASAGLIRERGITLIGVTLANLDDADAVQLELPFVRRDTVRLDQVLDRVRERYGGAAITRGVLMGTDPSLTVPMLPD